MELSASQKEWRDQVCAFAQETVAPQAATWDRQERTSEEAIRELAARGYLGTIAPGKYLGAGLTMVEFGLLNEELGRACSSLRSLLTVHSMVIQAIAKWGDEKQRQKWLPLLARGEAIAAFALTEPQAGSNAHEIQATATEHGDEFVLTGHKKWITFGQRADLFLVFARGTAGAGAFLVEKDRPGLKVFPIRGMLGLRGAMLADLHLEECRIPRCSLVGRMGSGIAHVAGFALDNGRYSVAWGAVGVAQACLDASIQYAAGRTQFGVVLKDHQLVQRMITRMVATVEASRLLCLDAGRMKDNRAFSSVLQTSIAKYFSSLTAMQAASDAVQIHGANGCSHNFPVERYFRDAKIMEIIEGSTEIQEITIAQSYSQAAWQRLERIAATPATAHDSNG
jgi:alkylation response protein AidB-like acyl-CoA dehydrogenase